ncbi:MAG TPA: radical SAM protein [Bryobacteraceae bacterium]|nr:radical SAM protein [Bryobacteraceae bacterium]
MPLNGALMGTLRRSSAGVKHRLEDTGQHVKRTLVRAGLAPAPFRIKAAVTDRCNFRCPTCLKWKDVRAQEELSPAQWQAAWRRLRKLPLMNEVTIGGGEPFARPGILDILASAREEGFYTVVISNGWKITPETLRELARLGVNRLILSLNSLRESVHDGTRNAPGSARRVLALIEAWRSFRKPELAIEAVVMEANVGELPEMARFVRDMGMQGLILQALAPPETHYAFAGHDAMPVLARDWYENDAAWVRSLDLLRAGLAELLALKRAGAPIFNPSWQLKCMAAYYENPQSILSVPCVGPVSTMHVDPFGNIRLCYGLPPIGNVLRDSPREIWRGAAARTQRREKRSCDQICRILNGNL